MQHQELKKVITGSPFKENSELYLSDDLLGENLKVLAEKNQKLLSDTNCNYGKFNKDKAADLVFNLCLKFDLPLEVKYVAVELFDQFMVKHVTELQEIVKNSSTTEKQLDWSSVESRVKDQVILRAMTCVQIASKLVSHYKAVHPSKLKRYLAACSLQYSISSINKSELRVLRTIDHKLSTNTPLVHIEMLLEVLNRNCPSLDVKHIHKVAVMVLDVSYLSRSRLSDLLSYASGNERGSAQDAGDHFLLATCVLVAASYIIDANSNDLLIEQIALVTCLAEADIIIYATILVKLALDMQ